MMDSQKHTIRYSLVVALIMAAIINLLFMVYTEYCLYLGGTDLFSVKPQISPNDKIDLMTLTSPLFWKRTTLHVVTNFLLLFILYYIDLKILYWKKIDNKFKMPIAFAINILLVTIFVYFDTLLNLHFNSYNNAEVDNTYGLILAIGSRNFSIMIIACLTIMIKYFFDRKKEIETENETLKTANFMYKYEVLKTKLNPHFLFNSLNTLDSLIAINSSRSSEFVHKLSAIYRYVLNQTEVTTVREELNFAKSYGDLLIIRYDTCLTIKYDVDENILDKHLLPFSIQLLLENVIKHNTISNNHPMIIKVTAREDKIEVTNPIIPRREAVSSSGLGLKMLNERINIINGQEIEISQHNNIFKVTIPVI